MKYILSFLFVFSFYFVIKGAINDTNCLLSIIGSSLSLVWLLKEIKEE